MLRHIHTSMTKLTIYTVRFMLLGIQLNFGFKIHRVRRVEILIPAWADDATVTNAYSDDGTHKVTFWGVDRKAVAHLPVGDERRLAKRHFIDLPKCSHAEIISIESRIQLINGQRQQVKHPRKVVIDLYR
jgi:hypothetical protein